MWVCSIQEMHCCISRAIMFSSTILRTHSSQRHKFKWNGIMLFRRGSINFRRKCHNIALRVIYPICKYTGTCLPSLPINKAQDNFYAHLISFNVKMLISRSFNMIPTCNDEIKLAVPEVQSWRSLPPWIGSTDKKLNYSPWKCLAGNVAFRLPTFFPHVHAVFSTRSLHSMKQREHE
jgi:hypothetical protein